MREPRASPRVCTVEDGMLGPDSTVIGRQSAGPGALSVPVLRRRRPRLDSLRTVGGTRPLISIQTFTTEQTRTRRPATMGAVSFTAGRRSAGKEPRMPG